MFCGWAVVYSCAAFASFYIGVGGDVFPLSFLWLFLHGSFLNKRFHIYGCFFMKPLFLYKN